VTAQGISHGHLGGQPFHSSEVKTLLEGITVGGHKILDAEQVWRLNAALLHVISQVSDERFEFEQGRVALNKVQDVIQRAFLVFLWGSLVQFFYDGNKRTARFLCNGLLMSAGFPPMMITAKEQLAYNQVMTRFYDSQDASEALIGFYDHYRARIEHFGFTFWQHRQVM